MRPCTDAQHEERRRTRTLDRLRPWPGEDFDVGECPDCGSTLGAPRDVEEVTRAA